MKNFVDFALGLRHGSKRIMERDGTGWNGHTHTADGYLFLSSCTMFDWIHDEIKWL